MLGIDRRLRSALLVAAGVALAAGLGCRRELPELFDRNKAPETYVTAAPVESLFDGFRVNLSWYGLDPDGEIAYFLWAWTDSSRAYFSAWNPENRAEDRILREGLFDATHLTTRNDSLFTIQANDNGGTSRDVTFNITAVDDQGKRDPVPARLYFFGSVDSRPQVIWLQEPPDTLDAGESFACRFTATTKNGYILGYKWASGADPAFEPRNKSGDQIWTHQIEDDCANVPAEYCGYQDSTAITLSFTNDIGGADADMVQFYKFGTFLIKARAVDLAGVESELNTTVGSLRGAVAPILNRDPDTRLRPWDGAEDYPVFVRYKQTSDSPYTSYGLNAVLVDTLPDGSPAPPGFHYAVRETVPWGEATWIRFFWQGWDYDDPIIAADPEDIVGAEQDTIKTRFQMSYAWTKLNLTNGFPFTANSNGRYPAGGRLGYPEQLEFAAFGEAGSDFEMNILPVDYTVYGYAQDYFERVDGTPVSVTFTGGYSSFVDSILVGAVGSTTAVNLTTLPAGDPVRIALHPSPIPFTGELVTWDPVTRTFRLEPSAVSGTFPNITNEFNLTLTFFGHDDPRNGQYAQLGRGRWDLIDPDYPFSSFQFVPDVFEPANQTTVQFWKDVFPGNALPPAEGSFTVQLRIRETFWFEAPPTPAYLGPKTFQAEFCNTIPSQVVTELIEESAQRQIGLTNIGRVSRPLRAQIDIQYVPYL
ncbi:hypothetical protein FJ251_01875 [bacterium]|nr:hypothetical protein [bacterium]